MQGFEQGSMVSLVFGKDPSGWCVEKDRNVGNGVPQVGRPFKRIAVACRKDQKTV